MEWTIPGTTLTARREDADKIDRMFQSMFLPGGMVLSQVASITGLEAYTIQNWVKRGFLASPKGKRYDMEQLCRILNINMLKGVFPLEKICRLLSYINGSLSDESDDLVDDTLLYFLFVRLSARARYIGGEQEWEEAVRQVADCYEEIVPGAREKLIRVLRVMLTAWVAGRLKSEAESMLEQLQQNQQ